MPQLVVIDQILIAERDAEYALRHHRRDRVLDLRLDATILKAGSEPRHQAERAIGRAEQQRSGVRRDFTTIERSPHLAPFEHS